jgi:hypothetical protein
LGTANNARFLKDGIHNCVVLGKPDAVHPEETGAKASAHDQATVVTGKTTAAPLRLTDRAPSDSPGPFGEPFAELLQARRTEANDFYRSITPERNAVTLTRPEGGR